MSVAGWSGGYGNCITIRHPDGKMTRYGHLSKILVSVGQKVESEPEDRIVVEIPVAATGTFMYTFEILRETELR